MSSNDNADALYLVSRLMAHPRLLELRRRVEELELELRHAATRDEELLREYAEMGIHRSREGGMLAPGVVSFKLLTTVEEKTLTLVVVTRTGLDATVNVIYSTAGHRPIDSELKGMLKRLLGPDLAKLFNSGGYARPDAGAGVIKKTVILDIAQLRAVTIAALREFNMFVICGTHLERTGRGNLRRVVYDDR